MSGKKAFNFTFSIVFNMHAINNPDTVVEWGFNRPSTMKHYYALAFIITFTFSNGMH